MLKIAKVEDKGDLYITVEGDDIESVVSKEARDLAYNERHKHGFSAAGISMHSRTIPREKKGGPEGEPVSYVYGAIYRLTRNFGDMIG